MGPRMTAFSRRQRFGQRVINGIAGLGLFYIFLPILVIVLFSFNAPKGKFNIKWQGFTLDNWANPFAQEQLTSALWVSLRIALISTFCATILGSLIALALSRYKFKGSGGINLFLVLPLTSPEIVLGSSLATLFINRGVSFGYVTVIIAHIMFQISFVAVTVRARIRGFDWTLEQAAMDLGATPSRAFWKITFPLILPGILAAALLSFALSIDDFIITFFNAGSLVTFPLQIFGASRVAIPPQINVLATMLLIASVSLMVAGTVLGNRRQRKLAGN
ncbi:MAG: ABC transporter permease [Acidobacteria bacterium]|nr:ABC transporter permease [Acidobacteriota bacterium]